MTFTGEDFVRSEREAGLVEMAAADIKRIVRQQLAIGKTEEQITDSLEVQGYDAWLIGRMIDEVLGDIGDVEIDDIELGQN